MQVVYETKRYNTKGFKQAIRELTAEEQRSQIMKQFQVWSKFRNRNWAGAVGFSTLEQAMGFIQQQGN